MKTTRNQIVKLLLLSLIPLPFLFTSCEESSYELRDEIIGSYDYELKAYIDDGESLTYIGDDEGLYDATGTVQARKNMEYSDMIDFYDGSDLLFQCERIRETDNSIVFDIPPQEFWLGAIPVTVRGIKYWDVGNDSYHGAYLYNDDSVEIAFAAEVMDVSSDLVLLFIAYKH
ncbi:MAG: hypothetical protein J7L96_01475 [Bacteroidales bacterium]|nr:hypothetical protein [Bacteroidales bacterium]